MEEVEDLYDDLLAFDDDLLPLETPRPGGDGKKRKMGDMLAGGVAELEPERPLKKAMEASVPPGLEQKVRRDSYAKASTEVPVLLSKPRSVSTISAGQSMHAERAIVPTDYVSQPPKYVRYFILKSNNLPNLRRSVENAVWATQPHNEGKLNEAYHTTDEVRLIFSVNQSGHFQGYARMSSPIGRGPKHGFWVGSSWGGLFQVDWELLYNLPFHKVEHLGNPMNEGKPVKIAKDGQEVPAVVAMEVIRLMREGAKLEGLQKPEPQHKLYIDPAPYFGPVRESRQRQPHVNSNTVRMRMPESMMSPLSGLDHGPSGIPNQDMWVGRYNEGPHPAFGGLGRGSTAVDRHSNSVQSHDMLDREGPPRAITIKSEPDHKQSPQGKLQTFQSPNATELKKEPSDQIGVPGDAVEDREKPTATPGDDPSESDQIKADIPTSTSQSPEDGIFKSHPKVKEESRPLIDGTKENELLVQNMALETKGSNTNNPMPGPPLQSLGLPKTNGQNKRHLFELTYDEYLDQYYKFQDQLRELISSGSLWQMLGIGVANGNGVSADGDEAGNKVGAIESSSGAGSGGGYGSRIRFSDKATSNGSVNKPMLESEYVEFCRRFCQAHSFSFDESKAREYYRGMRVQYEAMKVKGANGNV